MQQLEMREPLLIHDTAVPLTPHRHVGLDPVSSKTLKLLDFGLRGNDGRDVIDIHVSNTIGFPASQALR
ncbi:MAG: hypothetical protein GXP23_00685 [Gammaproteobacteria bacterium]|nr:hypothetical protein [Gammaproteobacteria bacterium]